MTNVELAKEQQSDKFVKIDFDIFRLENCIKVHKW